MNRRSAVLLGGAALLVLAAFAWFQMRPSKVDEDPNIAIKRWETAFNQRDSSTLWDLTDPVAIEQLGISRRDFESLMLDTAFHDKSDLEVELATGVNKRANHLVLSVLLRSDKSGLVEEVMEAVRTVDGWRFSFPSVPILVSAYPRSNQEFIVVSESGQQAFSETLINVLESERDVYTRHGLAGLSYGIASTSKVLSVDELISQQRKMIQASR